MKGLSVKEPFATWIAEGQKWIETRSWGTDYRGPLLICASAKPRKSFSLPYCNAGHALCIVTLTDVRPMRRDDQRYAKCDYRPNLKAFVFANRYRLNRPLPAKGALYLWDVDSDLVCGWKSEIEARYYRLYNLGGITNDNDKTNTTMACE